MGGNVQIGTKNADRIDLTKVNRSDIVKVLARSLNAINHAFETDTGAPMWNATVFSTRAFLSGSAFHFFDLSIKDENFVKFKESVGDIDTQVDEKQAAALEAFLTAHTGEKFEDLTLIGFKKSAKQLISLWSSDSFNINIQIDFELVEFDAQGHPTAWSTFSHSSAWEDMVAGVKGVAHKYIFRALSAKDLKPVILVSKTGKQKETLSAEVAFSPSGFRQKLEPVVDDAGNHLSSNGVPMFRELSTKETGFITDLPTIFSAFFGHTPTDEEISKMGSFIGTLELVKANYTTEQKTAVADGFANTLWGPSAQSLYREDAARDKSEKETMMKILCEALDIPTERFTMMKSTYYKD